MRCPSMSIVWEENDDDWQTRYGIGDDLAEQMGDQQDRGRHGAETGRR